MSHERLQKVLSAQAPRDSVRVEPMLGGLLVVVGPTPVLVLGPADADTLAGERLSVVAESAAARLRTALDAERTARSPTVQIHGLLWSLLATGILVLLIRLLLWLRRAVLGWLTTKAVHDVRSRHLGGFQLLDREQMRRLVQTVIALLAWVAGLAMVEIWLGFVLGRFPYTAPWGAALKGFVLGTVGGLMLGALRAVPGLFVVLVIVVFIRFLVRLVHTFFRAIQSERIVLPWMHPDTAAPTERIVVALLWVFGIVLSYPHLPGSDSDVFKGISVFVGLLVTLGSGGSVNQIMSGLLLVYARALRTGDYVRIGEVEGTVTEVGLLTTRVSTPWHELVTIPNAVVLGTPTTNYSRMEKVDALWFRTAVTIGYDAPWRQVHAMLLQAAERTAGIRRDPAPFVLQSALSDFYVEYTLNFRPEDAAHRVFVLSDLHGNIQDAFNEHGVQILSPHFMLQPEKAVVVPKEQWWSAPARREGPASGS
jgi:small-conductance mechanosensitive channel